MIFTIHEIKPELLKWHRWFAWYPIIVKIDQSSEAKVWLQYVWRIFVVRTPTVERIRRYEYKLEQPENEKEHSWDTYTIPPCSP